MFEVGYSRTPTNQPCLSKLSFNPNTVFEVATSGAGKGTTCFEELAALAEREALDGFEGTTSGAGGGTTCFEEPFHDAAGDLVRIARLPTGALTAGVIHMHTRAGFC